MKQDNTTATTAEHFTYLPPYISPLHHLAAQASFMLGRHIATFHEQREITHTDKFPLYFHHIFHRNNNSENTVSEDWEV